MKKKWLALLLCLSLMCTVLGAGAETVTLQFMNWGGAEEATIPAFDAMIEAFNAAHPDIQVESVPMAYNSMLEQLLILNASGQTPDVMQIHGSWTSALQGAGALANLDAFMTDELKADFYPNVLEALQYGGSQYALPWSPSPIVLYYNTALLAKAGYTEPPKTFEELATMARAIAALGQDENGNTIYGLGVQSKALSNAGFYFLSYIWNFGGNVVDENGTVVIDSPETAAAFNFAKELMDDGTSPVGLEIKDLRNLFAQGVLGFHIDADFGYTTFLSLAPDKDAFVSNLGIASIPGADGASNGFFIEHNLGIAESCANKEAAMTFIEWMSGPEGMAIYNANNGNKTPARKSVEALDFYKDPANGHMQFFINALDTSRALPEKTTGFNEAMLSIANALQRICINNEDAAQVVTELSTQLKDIYQ